MKRNVDHGKFALGAYGSTLLSGTAGLDLSGSSAKVYICAITTLTDYDVESTFSAMEAVDGENGSCMSSVTVENDLDNATTGIGAGGNGVDLSASILFPPGVTVYGKWDKVTMASGACVVYFAPKGI
jgi:hypothetical protein